MQKKDKDSNPPPVMNTLKAELLSNGKYNSILPNSREPVPFETDFFKGTSMLVVRTAPIDPHYRIFFEGKKRLFEVQVQGKFKRLPQGEIFVGAEASLKMELGLISRSVAKAAINLCSTMVGDLHSSLGDMKGNELYQLPHLVAPMFITFDKIVLTSKGETPPPLGIPFTEDLEYRKKRLKFRSIKDAEVDLETTYSFSVNTSNINLLTWQLTGIPLVRPMDLRTFIQESAIRLVGYEIPDAVLQQNPNDHPASKLNYVFNMNLRSVDPEEVVDLPIAEEEGDDEEEEENEGVEADVETGGETGEEGSGQESHDQSRRSRHAKGRTAAGVGSGDHREESDTELEQEDGPLSDDYSDNDGVKQGGISSPIGTPRIVSSNARGVSGWIRKHMSVGRDRGGDRGTGQETGGLGHGGDMPEIEVADVFESSEYHQTDYDLESTGDLAFCPGCLEMIHEGRRRIFYFLPLPEGHERTAMLNILDEIDLQAPRLRPFSEISKVLNLVPIPRMHKNRRLSSLERRRRQIVESYRVLMKSDRTSPAYLKFISFLNPITAIDRDYLEGNTNVTQRIKHIRNQENEYYEGYVGMAMSRRHWIEYHCILNKNEFSLYRKQHSNNNNNNNTTKTSTQRIPRRCNLRIKMSSIISVQPMRFQDIPLQGFSFFQIETFSRVYYFMIRSDIQLQQWIEGFVHYLSKDILHSPFDESFYQHINNNTTTNGTTTTTKSTTSTANNNTTSTLNNNSVQNPRLYYENENEAYLAKSACWKLDKKRILNYRRIIFNPAAMSSKYNNITPNQYIENILLNILFLSNNNTTTTSTTNNNIYQWVKFMDEISYLQCINISKLTEKERIAFFLNLYHIMVIHGSLVVGPPPAWNYWNAFFNNITYLFSYEIISISDVDFNILRAAMARPSSLSIIPVPHHQFPGLAVTQKDFRLNFCVNTGSKSMPSVVPIYSPQCLDELLDEMTARMLFMNTEIDITKKTVSLPKVSALDFTTRKAATIGTVATPYDILRTLLYYFSPEDRILATRILNENIHVTIRFKSQSLRCRKLRVYNPKESNNTIGTTVVKGGKGDPGNGGGKGDTGNGEDTVELTNSDILVDIYQELVA